MLGELLQRAPDRRRQDGKLGRVVGGADPERRLGEIGDHQFRSLLRQHRAERVGQLGGADRRPGRRLVSRTPPLGELRFDQCLTGLRDAARRTCGVQHAPHRGFALLPECQPLGNRGIEAAEIGGHLGDVVPQRRQARLVDPALEALMQPVETRHLAGDLARDLCLRLRAGHREQLRRRRDD